MPRKALENVLPGYVRFKHSTEPTAQIDSGLAWALRALNSTVALVTDESAGFRALDLVMDRLVQETAPAPDMWSVVLAAAEEDELGTIGHRAYIFGENEHARNAWQRSADTGDTKAMSNLGVLLANQWDPPQLDQARSWYEKDQARTWSEKAT